MKRTLRGALVALALPAMAFGAMVATSAAPASALGVDVIGLASISLDTLPRIDATDTLIIEAKGTTTGQLIDNTTVTLHVSGAEYYVDSFGQPQVAPIVASPSSISFSKATGVTFTYGLHPGSTLQVSYSAEVVGAVPTAAIHCDGEIARDPSVNGGSPFIFKTC
jgi:hypothetical protein